MAAIKGSKYPIYTTSFVIVSAPQSGKDKKLSCKISLSRNQSNLILYCTDEVKSQNIFTIDIRICQVSSLLPLILYYVNVGIWKEYKLLFSLSLFYKTRSLEALLPWLLAGGQAFNFQAFWLQTSEALDKSSRSCLRKKEKGPGFFVMDTECMRRNCAFQ